MVIIRRFHVFCCVLLVGGTLANGPLADDCLAEAGNSRDTDAPGQVSLVPPAFPHSDWKFYSGKKDAVVDDTWQIRRDEEADSPIIICKGEPYGYIQTSKSYRDFELSLEWRYPSDANGNSGVLLYTTGEDRIWPACIQVQLHQPELGSTFPHPGATSANEIRNTVPLARSLPQWNQCVVVSCNGTLTVTINGEKVGVVTGCNPQEGAIALQSEGSEIHFRKILIRELQPGQTVSSQRNDAAPRRLPRRGSTRISR